VLHAALVAAVAGQGAGFCNSKKKPLPAATTDGCRLKREVAFEFFIIILLNDKNNDICPYFFFYLKINKKNQGCRLPLASIGLKPSREKAARLERRRGTRGGKSYK